MYNFIQHYFTRSLFVLVFILSFIVSAFSEDYYVSNDGDDSNSGTSSEEAWKSLDKVNQIQFFAGDNIFFQRGDTWRGTLLIASSGVIGDPVTYSTYGEGAKPIIYGSEAVTGWTQHSGNIYKATVSFDVKQLFADGKRIRVARYPNEGYFIISSVQNETTFTSNQLDGEMDYTNATWYGRTRYWYGVIRKITASSSKTITISSAPNGNLANQQGFFLMDKLEFLDQPGEWYHDNATNNLYLWTPEGDSPDNYLITASNYPNGIYMDRVNYVHVNNLDVRECAENGFNVFGSTNCVIDNNWIFAPDQYGIHAEGGESHIISNNYIDRANGGGLYLWIKDTHVTDNIINNTGVFDEIGVQGSGAPNGGTGAEISGENNIIEYNIIENSNYNGLFYRGNGTMIQYNFINNSCLYKDDGGAIYTNTSGTGGHIRYNIILNSIGNPHGYIANRSLAEGIYIDETARDVIVEHNTIQNTGDAAIKLHNVGNIMVDNNRIMKSRYGIWCNRYVGSPSPIINNIVYQPHKADDYEPRPLFVKVGSYNTQFDYNKYINPNVYASTNVFKEDDYLNFENWQDVTNQDLNSTVDLTPLAPEESEELFYNASKSAKTFNLNGAVVRDVDGNSLTSTFTLEPFTSIILIGENMDNISEVISSAGEIKGNEKIKCYPNPFQNLIIIDVGRNSKEKFQVNIYSTSGTLVKKITDKNVQGRTSSLQWDGSDSSGREVSSGMYMVQVVSANIVETVKVFKSK